jgi:transcriptional regulator with XRE-family HTH domain
VRLKYKGAYKMRQNDIGKIIYTLRKHYNISQEMLSSGLCSDATLSRIELGERIPDKFLLDAILQRLGKSPDKLETILSERDYFLYVKRQAIEKAIFEHDFSVAETELKSYEEQKECEEKLHQQYVYKIKSILIEELENDSNKSIECLLSAIRLTLPEFQIDTIFQYLLSIEEIYLLLMLAQSYTKIQQNKEAFRLLHNLIYYLDDKYSDEEEKVKVYPKAVYLLSKLLLMQEKYQELVILCLKTIDLIVSNGVINCLLELLQLCLIGLRHQDNQELLNLTTHQFDSLLELYKEYEFPLENAYTTLFLENTQNELYLVNEFIKNSRIANGLSQEMLSDDICSPETLSRIESGKRAPSTKNFESLTKRMGINKDLYNSFLSADIFEVLEKKREYNKQVSLHQYNEAKKIFEDLKIELDITVPENQQFIIQNQTLLDYRMKKINAEQALIGYENALRCTMKNYGIASIKNSFISRETVLLLNQVAIIYFESGNGDKGIKLLQEVLDNYCNSKVDEKYHSVGSLLTMSNLSLLLEESGMAEEGIIICDRAIKLSLSCGRGNTIAAFLADKACCLEKIDAINKKDKNIKARVKYLKQAFYISGLMKDIQLRDSTKLYYTENYNDNENW